MIRAALLALMLTALVADAAEKRKSLPPMGLIAPDSTYRILRVGYRESYYPHIRSWMEPDTIRFVQVMWMPDSVARDSSVGFSVTGFNRCRTVAYRRDGAWHVDLECWRDAR